ncbi:MAG: type VI secretion system baseplate subunit TssE [Steroidobacteraceae bacterium]|jgi:type VI secretion system protein ImpF
MTATINSKTRLSPPLMHVFRAAHDAKDAKKKMDIHNEAGDRIVAGRRLRARQVITEAVLRREVLRDLDALLNAVAMESTVDMGQTPYARKSIINFGLPDVSNRTIDENAVDSIPGEIKAAIINYEPRLAAASLDVVRDMTVDPAELKIRFIFRADLTCDPVHVPVEFVADVVDTGKIIINRL